MGVIKPNLVRTILESLYGILINTFITCMGIHSSNIIIDQWILLDKRDSTEIAFIYLHTHLYKANNNNNKIPTHL